MATGTVDVIAPKAITLPTVSNGTTAPTGTIGMSGAQLIFYNGSVWKLVTTN